MSKYFILILSFLNASVLAQNLDSVKFENLLCFFHPKNTNLTLSVESTNADTVDVTLEFEQILLPRIIKSHRLVREKEGMSISDSFTLEMPVRLRLTINGVEDELFIVPGFHTFVHYQTDGEHLHARFADPIQAKINTYYDQKSSVHGFNDIRLFYNAQVQRESLSEIYETFDNLKEKLFALKSRFDPELPPWWRVFEEKNINQTDFLYRHGVQTYRQYVLDIREETQLDGVQEIDFEALQVTDFSTIFIMGAVNDFVRGNITVEEMRAMSRAEQMQERFSWHVNIDIPFVKDMYCASLYMYMLASPAYYPTALFDSIRSVVSRDAQEFLINQEGEFAKLDGKPAPNFHLKDLGDSLQSLHDFRGKVLLLDFWFVGCRGCILEWPYDSVLISEVPKEDFALIKVCMKSGRESCIQTISDNNLKGYHLISNEAWDQKIQTRYQISGYPRYVLIDREGQIVEGWSERPSERSLLPKIRSLILR